MRKLLQWQVKQLEASCRRRGPLIHGTDRTGPNSHTILRNGPENEC